MSKAKLSPLIVPEEILSQEEFGIREKAWEEYYKKVSGTKSYKLFQQIREAIRNMPPHTKGLTKEVKDLLKQNRELMEREHGELAEPNFADPSLSMSSGKSGTIVYWKEQIQKAREEGREVIYKNEQTREIVEPPTPNF